MDTFKAVKLIDVVQQGLSELKEELLGDLSPDFSFPCSGENCTQCKI